jgi:maltose O-acetyltransferase
MIGKLKQIVERRKLRKLINRGLKIGKRFDMFDSYIDYSHCFLVEIGDDVTISHSTILAHDGSTKKFIGKSRIGRVKIGNRVFIGYNSLILPNTLIGDDVIIGAGSVVTKDVPSNSIVAGVPARVIGKTSEFIARNKELMSNGLVYDVYWKDKSKEQINEICEKLKDGYAFDV